MGWPRHLLWLGGVWIALLWGMLVWVVPTVPLPWAALAAVILAPLPALLVWRRREARLRLAGQQAAEECARLKSQLETIRYRTSRLREELSAADRQARFSHQLALLGQFTAGFLHEYNNPLAILTSRLEVLLEERKEDAGLCADLARMLKEARYMADIAGTLLRALRRERGEETFTPCLPAEALREVVTALAPLAGKQGVRVMLEPAEVPRVSLPAHVLMEVARALISNSLDALQARADGTVWVRLEPYRQAGARVVLRIEDNGPGVPEGLRERLFQPFVSRSASREHLGLGLFLAASLMSMYDGTLRYESREGGGAAFAVEMPPERFTREQPFHWFHTELDA